MKKIVALVLCLVLMNAGCVSYAEETEDFSIRNGIQFGMSLNEVRSFEKLQTYEVKENLISTDPDLKKFLMYSGEVAGIKNSTIDYAFTEDDKLKQVYIDFDIEASAKTTVDNHYNTVQSSLKEKYGQPLDIPTGETYLFPGIISTMSPTKGLCALLGGKSYEKYAEWFIDVGNDHVKINHYSFTSIINGVATCTHVLEYKFISEEDMKEIDNEL